MNKPVKLILMLIVALVGGYGVYASQQENELSELALANVEALAGGEWNDGDKIDCWAFIVSPTPEELQNGVQYPIVVDCEPCGNLIIAKEASGQTKCTYYKH